MTRTIKIEEFAPKFNRPATKTQIRLKGKWLALAGFHPGGKVTVTVEQGKLTIAPN